MQFPSNINEIKQTLEKEVAPKVGGFLGIERFSLKNFRFNVIARISGITASVFGLSALWGEAGYSITTLGLGALIVFQVIGLIKHVESANREVVDFLNNIRYDDFSQTYKL
ncbi:MAG: hypothetical protein MUE81_10735, partial [Thermoflexibacter sp.]|nr:hypothetical protein [Thermoflexibacter sp.]